MAHNWFIIMILEIANARDLNSSPRMFVFYRNKKNVDALNYIPINKQSHFKYTEACPSVCVFFLPKVQVENINQFQEIIYVHKAFY